MQRVFCLIPARNEARRIAPVLDAVLDCRDVIDEICVINNGSTDNTAWVARAAGVRVIEYPEPGKGGAVAHAMHLLTEPNDIVLLLDADLRGITEQHIRELIAPVVNGRYMQSAGIRDGGLLRRNAWRYHVGLSGERCFRAALLWEIHELDYQGWALEVALNSICRWSPKRRKKEIAKLLLRGVYDTPKQEKLDCYETPFRAWRTKVRVALEVSIGLVRFCLPCRIKPYLTLPRHT